MQIMRVVLGETCTRFRPGPDGGRDGWFHGQAAGLLVSEKHLAGNFVIQCKHTSITHNPLDKTDLKKELKNVEEVAAKSPCHYILMTNRQVSAQSETAIREAFEAIGGVGHCLVLSESWIEDTIDAHPRLLRLVPRLYGIGDLSQIGSFVIQQQTAALLEDLAHSLRTFVPTESYRRAERALHEQRFVVLVGPPASGKSAIATNLCMVSTAQDANARVLRIEYADQFKNTWSPADAHTIYWVDDVFGETTLDDARVREWSAALEKVEAARKRGARIIFCTRDYILASAERQLKRNKADVINDARIRVDVTNLSGAECDAILYNHIKHGDISQEQKQGLKKHLSGLARLPFFSPELARRLGSRKFHQGLKYEWNDLRTFFEHPVQHFRDILHGLSRSETAALAVCLLSNNAVPDPIPDDALTDAVLKTYGVSMQQVREAFDMLDGSLVKRERKATAQTWQVHHPSMIEALQEELATKSSQFILYLQSAQLRAILRDTTTVPPEVDSRLVFLPESVYPYLIRRFQVVSENDLEEVAQYLAVRASDQFLLAVDAMCPETVNRALAILPDPYGTDVAPNLAVRLYRVNSAKLLGDKRRAIVAGALSESVAESGWAGFLDADAIKMVIPEFINEFLKSELKSHFHSVERLYYWYSQDLSSKQLVDSARDALEIHVERLRAALSSAGLHSKAAEAALAKAKGHFDERLQQKRAEIEENEELRAEHNYDEWQERWHEERYELETGRFADVDE